MICRNYNDVVENMKPGDKVFAVRHGIYDTMPPEKWPTVGVVSGTLQSSYFNHPVNGPHRPCHLLAENDASENAWDGPWWDLAHWTVCTSEQEALMELENQKKARIARAWDEIARMRAMLSDRAGISVPMSIDVLVPAGQAGEVPPVGSRIRLFVTGTLSAYFPDSAAPDGSRCARFRIDAEDGAAERV